MPNPVWIVAIGLLAADCNGNMLRIEAKLFRTEKNLMPKILGYLRYLKYPDSSLIVSQIQGKSWDSGNPSCG